MAASDESDSTRPQPAWQSKVELSADAAEKFHSNGAGNAPECNTVTDAPPVETAITTATGDSNTATTESASQSRSSPLSSPPEPPSLDHARNFLRDEHVVLEPPARKAAFLASKGVSPVHIDALLEETRQDQSMPATQNPAAACPHSHVDSSAPPPIVTFPEFLARPQRPPPLVTPDLFLGLFYGAAGAASLLYGTARLVLAPMVGTLTDARSQLHDTTGTNLTRLINQLETVVSELPPTAKFPSAGATFEDQSTLSTVAQNTDDSHSASSYDDPTEVFHRDVGVQTSIPPSPALPAQQAHLQPSPFTSLSELSAGVVGAPINQGPFSREKQANQLNSMVESLKTLSEDLSGPNDTLAEIQTTVGIFREDVDKLARPPMYANGLAGSYNFTSTAGTKYPGYVTTTRNEPDDEIRKVKENIRRVKGALLTARTFPTAR